MTNTQKQCLLAVLKDTEGKHYYDGQIDGKWGKKSQAAAERFLGDFQGGDAQEPEAAGDFWDDIKFFSRKEFRCPCGECNGFPVEPDRELVELLEAIREHFGKAVYVTSGVRCATHNDAVGGVKNSQHLYGIAADIVVKDTDPAEVYAYADSLLPNSGGVGRYDTFTHVDVRGSKSRWKG